MNTKSLIVLAVVVGACLCGKMSYNFQKASYKQDSNGRYEIKIPMAGGYAPYTFQYSGLPVNWDYLSDGTIFVPKSQFNAPGSYPIRCSIRDSSSQETRVSIVIVVTSNTIEIENKEYDYDYNFSGLGRGLGSLKSSNYNFLDNYLANYGIKGSSVTSSSASSSTSSIGSSRSSGFGISSTSSSIGSSSNGVSVSGSSSSGISRTSSSGNSGVIAVGRKVYESVESLPSSRQLDRMIGAADIVSITKTIQEVVSSNVQCTQKISYLNNFLGRIRSAVEMKKIKSRELRLIIENAKSAIAKLNIELQSYINKQKNSELQQQKILLTKSVASLQILYQQFNSASNNRKELQIKLQNFKRTVISITEETSNAEKTLRVDQIALSDSQQVIRELEIRLTQARNRRAEIQKRVEKSIEFISQYKRKITVAGQQISRIEISIKNADSQIERYRAQYLKLEVEIQQIKVQVSRFQSNNENIDDKISQLRIEIESRRSRIDSTELNKIEEMVSILTGALPKIQQTVDKINLECRGVSEFSISSTTEANIIRYEVSSNSFLNYIRNAYGFNTNLRFGSNNIYLSPISIFSDDWERIYGAPFITTQNESNSNIFEFDDDFTCSEGGNGLSGSILNITGNSIRVKGDDDYDYDLVLGSCSRIQAAKDRDYLPKKGDHIYWRGDNTFGSSRKYRVSSATCY